LAVRASVGHARGNGQAIYVLAASGSCWVHLVPWPGWTDRMCNMLPLKKPYLDDEPTLRC